MAEVILRLGPNNLQSRDKVSLSQGRLWWVQHFKTWTFDDLLLRDPYFFQIVFCQGEKYPQVNVLLLQ